MVRIIAGTLVEVGEGKIKPEKVKTIIESKDRKKAGKTLIIVTHDRDLAAEIGDRFITLDENHRICGQKQS